MPVDVKILVVEATEKRAKERARQVSSLGYTVVETTGIPDIESTGIDEDITVIMVQAGLLRGTGIDRLRTILGKHHEATVIFMVDNEGRIGSLNEVTDAIYDYLVVPSSDQYMNHVIDIAVDRRARFLLEKYYQSYLEEQVSEQLQSLSDKQMRLLHADRLSSIGQVAAGIIHELNNPLTYIKLNLETMEIIQKKCSELIATGNNKKIGKKDKTDNIAKAVELVLEAKDLLGTVLKGVDQIQNILSNIRKFSRKPEKTATEFDVEQAISNALNFSKFSLKKNIVIKKEFAGGLPYITGDPPRLEQVFLNLLINAFQAMEGRRDGLLTIKTAAIEKNGRSYAQVKFFDNGCGIPPAIIKKIFDPFITTKPKEKGTGLGLSISSDIVEEFSGKLDVESEEGKGSTFTLILPGKKQEKNKKKRVQRK